MIDREAKLPIKRQAEVLSISRGSVYYHPEPVPEAELALMRRIDELHLEHAPRLPPTRRVATELLFVTGSSWPGLPHSNGSSEASPT